MNRSWVRILPGLGHFSFLLSFPTFLHHWSVLNEVTQGGASLTVYCDSKVGLPGGVKQAQQAQQAQIVFF